MNKKIKQWLSIFIIITILLVIGITIYLGMMGNSAFWGMLGIMFLYPILLWLILFFYKKNNGEDDV
ncbi:MAG: hypothetical protein PHD56_11870 [Anaerostipes sp.]|nr:hypothetical protein [Anaerostipes sp.]